MCAAAIHWAKLDAVIFGAGIDHAMAAGFHELAMSVQSLYDAGGSAVRVYRGVLWEECVERFKLWKSGPNPTPY